MVKDEMWKVVVVIFIYLILENFSSSGIISRLSMVIILIFLVISLIIYEEIKKRKQIEEY